MIGQEEETPAALFGDHLGRVEAAVRANPAADINGQAWVLLAEIDRLRQENAEMRESEQIAFETSWDRLKVIDDMQDRIARLTLRLEDAESDRRSLRADLDRVRQHVQGSPWGMP